MNGNAESQVTANTVDRYEIAVVGGGPIGVHIAGRLISDCGIDPGDIAIVDPHEALLANWQRRAENCGMTHLRSPASHGVDPDFRAIRRQGEGRDYIPPYHRPSVPLFSRHLNRWIRERVSGVTHIQGTLCDLRPGSILGAGKNNAPDPHTQVGDRLGRLPGTEDWRLSFTAPSGASTGGSSSTGVPPRAAVESGSRVTGAIDASAVILAVGQPEPVIPFPFYTLPEGAPFSHVHHRTVPPLPPGSRVAVVGGGIAAAHLSLDLAKRGITVEIWNRDRMTVWQFDSDPCFIGPRCGEHFRAIANPEDRAALIRRSRRPGSIPPDLARQLAAAMRTGRVVLLRGAVTTAVRSGTSIALSGRARGYAGKTKGRPIHGEYDHVVLCTGFEPGAPIAAILSDLAARMGLSLGPGGFPVPGRDLSWAPGLYLAGALAELEIGPPARNLIGAHLAGRRIVPAIARLVGAREPRAGRARAAVTDGGRDAAT